jgi:hypothetical protein
MKGQKITTHPRLPHAKQHPEMVSPTGGRFRYFLEEDTCCLSVVDVVSQPDLSERYLDLGYDELTHHQYLWYSKLHAGAGTLTIRVDDATHTKLRNRVTELRAGGGVTGEDGHHEMTIEHLVEGIVAAWVEQHLYLR